MSSLNDLFANRLREVRERQELSQDELARRMRARGHDFRQQTIYKIETGNRRVIISEAVDLAEALGYTFDDFIEHAGTPNLSAALERLDFTREELQASALRYERALLRVAQLADSAEQLFDRDQTTVRNAIEFESPAQALRINSLAGGAKDVIAENKNEGTGEFVTLLLEMLERDNAALRGAALDVINRE